MTYEYAAYGIEGDVLMARSTQTSVLIEVPSRRPITIPEELRAQVEAFEA